MKLIGLRWMKYYVVKRKHNRKEEFIQDFRLGNLKESDHLEDLGLDGRILLY